MTRDELGTIRVIELRGELDPQGFDQGYWQKGHGSSK